MKKLLSIFALTMILIGATCCAGSGDIKNIAEKMNAGEELTEQEYDEALTYIETAFTDLEDIAKEVSDGKIDMTEAQEKVAALEKKHEYMKDLGKCLDNAPEQYKDRVRTLQGRAMSVALQLMAAGVNME